MAALTVVVVLATIMSVAVHADPDQGGVLMNCITNSTLSEERGKKLLDTIFDLKDIPNMEDDVKGVYYCLLSTLKLVDDNYCLIWEKVSAWYADQLPESVREKYMKKYKADIMACDTGCKPEEKSKNMNVMLTATKCVFELMRKVEQQLKEL